MKTARLAIMFLGCVALLISVISCGKNEPQKSQSASKSHTKEQTTMADTKADTTSAEDTQRPTAETRGRPRAPVKLGQSGDVPSKEEGDPVLPKGIRVEIGDLAVTGRVEPGGTFHPSGKIQQFYVWNVGERERGKLKATILLYDSAGKEIGKLTEETEGQGPAPGVAWAFYIEVSNEVANTKVSKIVEEE